MSKTNAVRILESKKIMHETIEYEFNENEIDAISVADKIGADHESVFKTLIARGDKTGVNVFIIPGNYQLDLKKAATVSGNKKIEMIKEKELLPLTGYVKGGCSPIGMKKEYPTFLDETVQICDEIFVSAGVRGMQVKISPKNLTEITNAMFVDLI